MMTTQFSHSVIRLWYKNSNKVLSALIKILKIQKYKDINKLNNTISIYYRNLKYKRIKKIDKKIIKIFDESYYANQIKK